MKNGRFGDAQIIGLLKQAEGAVPVSELWGVVAWILSRLILRRSILFRMPKMPHKFNADRREKYPKQKYRTINWAEYNEGQTRSVTISMGRAC